MSISNEIPTYRQLNPQGFWCDGNFLIEEGEVFEFEGAPNEYMEALNEPARVKLSAYFKELDAGAREVAEKAGRTYVSTYRTLDEKIAEATMDARRVSVKPGDGGVPLMAAQHTTTTRRVSVDAAPPVYRRKTTGRSTQ